jgi:hypothetical protein
MNSKYVIVIILLIFLGVVSFFKFCKQVSPKKPNWILPITILQNDILFAKKNALTKQLNPLDSISPQQVEIRNQIIKIDSEIINLSNWQECIQYQAICPTCMTPPAPGCCPPKPTNGIMKNELPCILSKRKLTIAGYGVSNYGDCLLYCPNDGFVMNGSINLEIKFEDKSSPIIIKIDETGYVPPFK